MGATSKRWESHISMTCEKGANCIDHSHHRLFSQSHPSANLHTNKANVYSHSSRSLIPHIASHPMNFSHTHHSTEYHLLELASRQPTCSRQYIRTSQPSMLQQNNHTYARSSAESSQPRCNSSKPEHSPRHSLHLLRICLSWCNSR